MRKEIVVIHGWGTSSYNANLDCSVTKKDIAWKNREEFISNMRKSHTIRFFNLPGFCCVKEPETEYFDVEDFSEYFAGWLKRQKVRPSAIIGYSFGGVVALDYKVRYRSRIPVVLIAPALKRKESIKSLVGKIGKIIVPSRYLNYIKPLYQSIFNTYYRKGTPFLRASYDKIVRRDIRPLLKKVDPKEVLLIYGDSDTSTPVEYISTVVEKNDLNCVIIKDGDHNIGGTHSKIVSESIINFIKNA